MSEVESQKKCSQQREKEEEYVPQLVWYQRDAAASDVLESFWSPRKPQTVQCFSWRMKETSQGLWYILCLNEQNRHYSRGERECTFLTTWQHWSRFFWRRVLQNGLKCKAFKCKSMAFVFTWATHILYKSTTMFRRTETTSSTIFDTQF